MESATQSRIRLHQILKENAIHILKKELKKVELLNSRAKKKSPSLRLLSFRVKKTTKAPLKKQSPMISKLVKLNNLRPVQARERSSSWTNLNSIRWIDWWQIPPNCFLHQSASCLGLSCLRFLSHDIPRRQYWMAAVSGTSSHLLGDQRLHA